MTTVRSVRNGDPVDLDAAYTPPWGNPGYLIDGAALYSLRNNRKCEACDVTWRGDSDCPFCGEAAA